MTSLWKGVRLDVFGSVLDYSGAAFAPRDDCVSDASRCGYVQETPVAARPNAARRGSHAYHPRCTITASAINPSLISRLTQHAVR